MIPIRSRDSERMSLEGVDTIARTFWAVRAEVAKVAAGVDCPTGNDELNQGCPEEPHSQEQPTAELRLGRGREQGWKFFPCLRST